MNREVEQLIKKIRQQGWEVVLTNGGHYRACPPDGGRFVVMSQTPGDRRTILNVRAQLRRAGADL